MRCRARAHRAHDDAAAATRIAQAVAAAFPAEVAGTSPGGYSNARLWFSHWRDDVSDWLQRQGGDRMVAGEWPG